MKNLILSVVLLLTVSFAFAANDVETVSTFDDVTVELTNSVELADADFTIEIEVEYASFDASNTAAYPCRWRTCTYINGVLQGCTAWTYGECLDEIVIIAKR